MIPPEYCGNARDLLADVQAAGLFDCASCNACRPACTVHIAGGRLEPWKLVRTASLGMLDQVLRSPELWYCLQCRQCTSACPMGVTPAELVARLRCEATRRAAVPAGTPEHVEALRAGLQRARWHAIAHVLRGGATDDLAGRYAAWADCPVEPPVDAVQVGGGTGARLLEEVDAKLGFATDLSACMTCGECTAVCPVAGERDVYDPVVLFRMAGLGLDRELLGSPWMWMCLECESCTRACKQGVHGHLVIRALRALAVERGAAPPDMGDKLWQVHQALLPRFLRQVDDWIRGAR